MEVKILKQKPERRCGAISALFEEDGKWYYADLADIPLYGNECMIFKANDSGEVTDWSEAYCNRSMSSVDEDNLLFCIKEFCAGLRDLRDMLEADYES